MAYKKLSEEDMIQCTMSERGQNCIQNRDGKCTLLIGPTKRQPCSFFKVSGPAVNGYMPGTSLIRRSR